MSLPCGRLGWLNGGHWRAQIRGDQPSELLRWQRRWLVRHCRKRCACRGSPVEHLRWLSGGQLLQSCGTCKSLRHTIPCWRPSAHNRRPHTSASHCPPGCTALRRSSARRSAPACNRRPRTWAAHIPTGRNGRTRTCASCRHNLAPSPTPRTPPSPPALPSRRVFL